MIVKILLSLFILLTFIGGVVLCCDNNNDVKTDIGLYLIFSGVLFFCSAALNIIWEVQ